MEIHLGSGDYPGYRADRLFGVSMAAVASPELVKGTPPLREPADLAHHVLLHDDAMELVAGGNAWQRWLENAGVGRAGRRAAAGRVSPRTSFRSRRRRRSSAWRSRCSPLVDADLASGRLCAPFDVEMKPQSAYYLVCPEVIAERPAVSAFRKWLLEQV